MMSAPQFQDKEESWSKSQKQDENCAVVKGLMTRRLRAGAGDLRGSTAQGCFKYNSGKQRLTLSYEKQVNYKIKQGPKCVHAPVWTKCVH